jgi:integrase
MRPALAMPSMGEIRQKSYTVGLMDPRQDTTPTPERTFLTLDEVRRLFAVITGTRDRALFRLAYHYGLRVSEVSLLQRQDIHARQGRIYIPRVKGSISNTYPLQPEDLRRLRAYLRTREDDSPALFISTRGLPLERRSYLAFLSMRSSRRKSREWGISRPFQLPQTRLVWKHFSKVC